MALSGNRKLTKVDGNENGNRNGNAAQEMEGMCVLSVCCLLFVECTVCLLLQLPQPPDDTEVLSSYVISKST